MWGGMVASLLLVTGRVTMGTRAQTFNSLIILYCCPLSFRNKLQESISSCTDCRCHPRQKTSLDLYVVIVSSPFNCISGRPAGIARLILAIIYQMPQCMLGWTFLPKCWPGDMSFLLMKRLGSAQWALIDLNTGKCFWEQYSLLVGKGQDSWY